MAKLCLQQGGKQDSQAQLWAVRPWNAACDREQVIEEEMLKFQFLTVIFINMKSTKQIILGYR